MAKSSRSSELTPEPIRQLAKRVPKVGMKKPQDLKGPGRPKAAIDLGEVEKLGALHATDCEIADWFDVTRSTITRRKSQSKKFREAVERGRSRGRVSLRRHQFEAAQAGNPAMLIWLGKQWLHQQQTVGVPEGGPAKSLFPDWMERLLKGEADKDEPESSGQNPDDPVAGNGEVQRSHVESRSNQPTEEGKEQQDA
jgi:hypothetical protein